MPYLKKITNVFRKFYDKFGMRGVFEFIFHPILLPLFVVPTWIKSLWNSRVLLYGQWNKYHGFHPCNTMNYFFYKTQWLNFERYGRRGVSPVVGLGNYQLSNWFHLTMLSSCLYANAGAVVMLGGTLIFTLSHLIWISVVPWQWAVLITTILFFSLNSYWMAFVVQNYNILGWMWLPLGFYAVLTHQYPLAAFAWFLASLSSITSIFFVSIMLLFMTIFGRDLGIAWTVIPAIIKIFFNLLPLLQNENVKNSLVNTAKIIGLVSREVKYSRESSQRWNYFNIYFFFLYSFSCMILWWASGTFPIYPTIALTIFAINQVYFRLADEESAMIFFSSVLTFSVMQTNEPSAIFSLIFLFPFPALLDFSLFKRSPLLIRPYTPFDHTELTYSLNIFFEKVSKGSRILFSFDDPGYNYDKIFDGYRIILEPALFVAAQRKIHLFPDWYAIAETNYKGSQEFWEDRKRM